MESGGVSALRRYHGDPDSMDWGVGDPDCCPGRREPEGWSYNSKQQARIRLHGNLPDN